VSVAFLQIYQILFRIITFAHLTAFVADVCDVIV